MTRAEWERRHAANTNRRIRVPVRRYGRPAAGHCIDAALDACSTTMATNARCWRHYERAGRVRRAQTAFTTPPVAAGHIQNRDARQS